MFEKPRGTRDFDTKEMQKRRYVEESMRSTFQRFGYREVQTPVFENLDLFTMKSGEEIIEELYAFKDKGGRELALRPELTAPVIRFYVNRLQMEPKPLKLFYFGNCFRYDRPQKGRYREFWQIGCELIGPSSPEALAELVALAYFSLKNTGLRNTVLRIGHVGWLNEELQVVENAVGDSLSDCVDTSVSDWEKHVFRLIDKEDFDAVEDELEQVGADEASIKRFMAFLDCDSLAELEEFVSSSQLNEYKRVFEFLRVFGVDEAAVSMKIARGLEYYSGLVFEIDAPALGAEKQVCGGGEYALVPLFGGSEIATSGFAIGFDRTVLALETEGFSFPEETVDAYVVPVTDDVVEEALKVVSDLRVAGALVDVDLMRRGVGKSLKHADSLGCRKVILVGPEELKEDAVTIRDMRSGEQTKVKTRDIIYFI